MRDRRTVGVWALAALLAGASAFGASAPWGQYAAWKVRRTVGVPPADKKQPTLPGSDCCYISFPTAGFLAPDARDVRVVVGGKPTPFRVIDVAADKTVRLVAAVPKLADRMHVYYGNPQASAARTNWVPRRGLWVETRRYLGGPCTTLTGIRRAWEKAKGQRYGAGPTGSVYHGHNPFGPQDNFLTRYTGHLYLAKPVVVNFAVSADEIGYVVVAGREAAAKRTWGPMNRGRRYTGEPMTLTAGLHTIQVYHAERAGPQSILAAWWMPGMKRGQKYKHFAPIPTGAFAPLRYGRLLNYEVRGQTLGADFSYVNEGDVPLERGPTLVRLVFRDLSRPANRALQCSPLWSFGDGTTSTARDPSHVFLRHGTYTATLTLRRGEQTWSVAQTIVAGPAWHRMARRQWDRLRNYHAILKDYPFETMATQDLITAARVFEELEKPEEILAACNALYARRKSLDEAAAVRHCLLLGRHVREWAGEDGTDGPANARRALAIFTYAETRTRDVRHRARLANEKGDVYYYFLSDLEKAQQEYTRTLTAFAKAADNQVRLAQIRLGDVYRTKGDTKAARAAYERAAQMPIHNHTEAVSAARRGSFPRTVEDYLRREIFKEAHQELDNWDWEFPTDKLEGYSSLLRAKVALAEENETEALKQANELLAGNKDSEYADDILLFLAGLHQKAGRLDKALGAAARLLADYPASELQEPTRLKRVAINIQRAKFADAAAEALELANANEDGANAPQALFLAATAHLRLKKHDDAIRTLERIALKYGDTAEAERARQMLKELRRR